jgi:flavin reductase (DIM6/NTAB) family NADH-FMN oxidoreductase RutF
MKPSRTVHPISPSDCRQKTGWEPGTMLFPLPVVLVSCRGPDGRANLVTVAWAGIVCTEPPMLSISLTPQRFSHDLIISSRQFAVNLPSGELARAVDLCGVKSGRDVDKFALSGLSKGKAERIQVPVVAECPIVLECELRQTLPLGSHTMFVAEIVWVQVATALIQSDGRLDLARMGPVAFAHGAYWSLGKVLGGFGFSVRKHA